MAKTLPGRDPAVWVELEKISVVVSDQRSPDRRETPGSKIQVIKSIWPIPAPRYWATAFPYLRHHRPPLAVIGD
jgi:hypothetical protein